MSAVSEAVILIAGQGSRLREADKNFLKPFVPVLGRPLLSYILQAVSCARISTVYFVVGYESERVIAKAKQLIPSHINASFIVNGEWEKQNGISLLAAAGHVTAPFLLTMGDHVFNDSIMGCLLDNFEPGLLNLAIDRKLNSIFDLHDAMKVRTRKDRVIDIGKDLRDYDAVDIGLFVSPVEIFTYLDKAKFASRQNDCSLADAIRLMALDGKTQVIEIGDAWWQDVDTPGALRYAEQNLTALVKS